MPKKYHKDYIEKLINHTMRHGRKAAAIGLLVKTFSLFGQKLIRQKATDSSVDLRRSRSRPQLLSVPLCKATLNKTSPSPFGYNEETRRLSNIEVDSFAYASVTSAESERTTLQLLSGKAEIRRGTTLMSVKGIYTNQKFDNQSTDVSHSRNLYSLNPDIATDVNRLVTASPKLQRDKRPIKQYVRDAISNVKPTLETRKKKIAGISRHIPSVVPPSRGEGLAIRWIVAAARDKQRRTNKGFVESLSDQLLDAYLKRGEVRQKRDSLHKLAEGNRSHIRYRWW